MRRVSVIIPSFGRSKKLSHCINSILSSDIDEIEIVIVDCPKEGTYASDKIRLDDSRIKRIKLPRREPISHARNLGFAMSRGYFVFFLDSDNIILDDTIPKLIAVLDDPIIGVAGPIAYYASQPKIIWNSGTYKSKFFRLHKRYCFNSGYPYLYDAGIIPNAFMTRRDVLERVGLFDSLNFPLHEDDADWQWRCREHGFRTVVCSKAVTRHDIPLKNFPHFNSETLRESFKSRFWIERKHEVRNILGFSITSSLLLFYYTFKLAS